MCSLAGSWLAGMILAGCVPEPGAGCVMGKSERDPCCEVSFCILDKPQRHLLLGQEGRGPGSYHIAVDRRGKGGVFHPIPARNPGELWSHSLEVMPKQSMELPSLSWYQGSRT